MEERAANALANRHTAPTQNIENSISYNMRQHILTLAAALCATIAMQAQEGRAYETLTTDATKAAFVEPALGTLNAGYSEGQYFVGIMANADYDIAADPEAPWLSATPTEGGIQIGVEYSHLIDPRTGTLTLTTKDGTCSRTIDVVQASNNSATTISGDIKLQIGTAYASQSQQGEGISNTYDGKTGTLWHSPYSGTSFPITLEYTLKAPDHLDYIIYTPRQDGNVNGNFRKIAVAVSTADDPDNFKEVATADLEGSGLAARIDLGEGGIDNVKKVVFTVKSGENNFASCAEMGFYKKDGEFSTLVRKYFKDDLCTQLADGVDAEEAARIPHPYVRQLVTAMLAGDYSTKYRVAEFEAYKPIYTLLNELKNSNPYCAYENPTGIYFEKGQTLALFVEGVTTCTPVLRIYCFAEGSDFQTTSSYVLTNGVNVINVASRGNGYISYYADDWETIPNVKIHFAMATENGYFDLERGDTNEYWQQLLANAKSDVLDIRCKRMQVPAPISILKQRCPKKGVELATIYDNVIYREREIMGLVQGIPGFTPEPKNRQFARPVTSGMYANNEGANAAFGSFGEWCNPDNFGYWGIAHELGHNNQIRNGLKWTGCTETTNNIYASWVEHTLGNGYHRLEDEVSGIENYSNMRGGRFNAYLEEGVRKGKPWQLQEGPDYYGSAADGPNNSRNYDHFVKVVPLYQLALWTQDCGYSPDAYGKVIQGYRTLQNNPSDNGQQQLNFMRNFCDSTQIDFLDFFERAGMLRPINAYIEDYSRGWNKITQAQIDDLRAYISAKGYPKAPAGLNYLNAYNIENFRNKVPLDDTQTIGKGCAKAGEYVTITHSYWKGAVAFEAYDADGSLTGISMYGLGDSQKASRRTKALFPQGSKYIMAVGYDGKRVKAYETK